ncbi:hypothetical protein C1A58_23010 [Salmonella enterica]|nr:hypothetical protein [Salmonella enterica subsp. enterica serovar Newport]EAM8984808.1 hypothetical protein [Salmonella enterica]ECB7561403.1 hypothetical protein [Salmonella enterica subsp. enterica serovar Schwarzengrund]KAA8855859.1 hypothetical protein F3Y17_27805 [Klebsiella pneumoniae]PPX79059.1 hypothetical protein C3D83_19990 [Cronobacter sakazakii]
MNRLMWNAFYRSHALPKIDSFFKSQVTLSLKWSYTIRNRDFHRNCMNYKVKTEVPVYLCNTQRITTTCNHMKIKK